MPERHEDGSWSGVPNDRPLMGDPPPGRENDTLNCSELVTALEIARLVLSPGHIEKATTWESIAYLGDQLDISDAALKALGIRLEHVLEVRCWNERP
jgi:hypothetical protein